MSGYFNNLQDETYRPSSRSTRSRSSHHRRRGSYGNDSSNSSSSRDNDSNMMDAFSSSRFRDEVDTRAFATRPLCRTRSSSSASSRFPGSPVSASTTKSIPSQQRRNKKTKLKQQVTSTKTVKTTRTVQQKGGEIVRQDVEETPAVIETVVQDASGSRGSLYGHTSGRSGSDREDESFHSNSLNGSSSYRSSSAGRGRKSGPDIYDAFKRLSVVSRDQASSALHEEEHSSNNTHSQQTPATSTSTQMSSTEDEDHSHLMMTIHSPSSSHQPPRQSLSSEHTNDDDNNNVINSNREPTNMRIATQQDPLEKRPSSASTNRHQQHAEKLVTNPIYQRKNSKNKSGKRESASNSIPNPQQERPASRNRNGDKPRRPSQQQQQQVDTKSKSVPMSQSHQQQPQPVRYAQQQQAPTRSSVKREDAELSPPRSSLPESPVPLSRLKNTLLSGTVDSQYSQRMDDVKNSIRGTMKVSKKSKSQMSDSSHSSSSSSSRSGRGGFRAFLGRQGSMPKTPLTDEERRMRDNPFLNRPTVVKKFTTIGPYEDDSSNHHDHRRQQDGGSDMDENSIDGSGLSQNHNKEKLTFQQKYCPLPKPVMIIHEFCGKIVTNQGFQIVMVVLIMLNAVVLGIATYDFPDNPKIPEALDIMDRTLLAIFTIELALQFGYCGYTLFLDGWLVFDTLTVVTSWWLQPVQVFRSFRIFRSFRLIVRLPLLKNLVLTVFHVMPRVYSILGLMLLILYIFGVLVTVLFGETHPTYFGRLDYSLFTLFQMVTLEGWGDIVRSVADEHPWYAALVFSAFIIVTGFIMYNLIVAVMCDSMLVIEAAGREETRERKRQKQMLQEMAKEQEAKKLEDEMVRQRAIEKGTRYRVKGLVSDDPTIYGSGDRIEMDGDTVDSLDNRTEGDDESVVEMRNHRCENCGFCDEIPKVPAALRRQNRERDRLMTENQERVRSLKQKVDQLVGTQHRVTTVLQTLVLELEAQRRVPSSGSGTYVSGRTETTQRPMEEDNLK